MSSKDSKKNTSEERLVELYLKSKNLQNRISCLVNKVVEAKLKTYCVEINPLNKKVKEITTSQNFVSGKYDGLKDDYEKLLKTCNKQNKDLKMAKKKFEELEQNTFADSANLDNLEQYGRRQNLEFHAYPKQKMKT